MTRVTPIDATARLRTSVAEVPRGAGWHDGNWLAIAASKSASGINLAIGLIFDPLDWGKLVKIAIRIVDPDGAELVSLNAQPISFQPPYPGYPAVWFNTLSINVVFPREGTYSFQLRVDGLQLSEVPLYVGPSPK